MSIHRPGERCVKVCCHPGQCCLGASSASTVDYGNDKIDINDINYKYNEILLSAKIIGHILTQFSKNISMLSFTSLCYDND